MIDCTKFLEDAFAPPPRIDPNKRYDIGEILEMVQKPTIFKKSPPETAGSNYHVSQGGASGQKIQD